MVQLFMRYLLQSDKQEAKKGESVDCPTIPFFPIAQHWVRVSCVSAVMEIVSLLKEAGMQDSSGFGWRADQHKGRGLRGEQSVLEPSTFGKAPGEGLH